MSRTHLDRQGLRQHTFRVVWIDDHGTLWEGGAVRDDRVAAYVMSNTAEYGEVFDLVHDAGCVRCHLDNPFV